MAISDWKCQNATPKFIFSTELYDSNYFGKNRILGITFLDERSSCIKMWHLEFLHESQAKMENISGTTNSRAKWIKT